MIPFFEGDSIKIPLLIILLCTAFLLEILREGEEFSRRQAISNKFYEDFEQNTCFA
jgi:hypothetical protein